MRLTESGLRLAIREMIARQMMEQDQNGDGEEDFDDVRIARMIKGGVSKEDAIARVKKRPMGDSKRKSGEG
jgi:hypothetical protein